MPVARFQMPDGRIARFEVPEGTTPEQAQELIAQSLGEQKVAPAAAPISRMEKIGVGVTDPIHGGAQLLTKMLPANVVKAGNELNNWLADQTGLVARLPEGGVDQQVREREAEYQSRRSAAGESGFDGYRTIGNVVSPANVALARVIPGSAGNIFARSGAGATGGALTSALAPVTEGEFSEQKKRQILTGTLFGGATPAVIQGVSRVISPKASVNPDLKMLRDEGVKPTIGQTLGGMANAFEQKATSIPVIGDMIAGGRRNAVEQFNTAALNRAVAPIGKKVEGTGTEAVKQAGDLIGDAYTAAKAQLGGFRVDQQAKSELDNLRQLASSGLEGREKTLFDSYFKNYIEKNTAFTPEKFKALDSKLGKDIRTFSGSGDAYQQKLGEALEEVQRILLENAKRANPKAAQALSAADEAYANLVRVEGASTIAKGSDGVFTPGQLLTAVRQADKSTRDRATARGTALMQDLAGAGQKVLGNTVPDSGTPGRLAAGGLGAAAMYDPMMAGGALGAGLVAYTPPIQSLLRSLVADRPEFAQPIADALQKSTPLLIPAGAQIGRSLLQN